MIDIETSDEYVQWFAKLKDSRARAKINARIKRLSLGNSGDVEPVGNGISEMRIHYGPGYRVYYLQKGSTLVILLCGGDKDSQHRDIKDAKQIASDLKD